MSTEQSSSPIPSADPTLEESRSDEQHPQRKRPLLLIVAAAVLTVAFYFALGRITEMFTHESTDDAFIEGPIISIAPKVAGEVVAVHVHDNHFVKKSDPLLEIDPRDYDVRLAQKKAASRTSAANLKTVFSVLELMAAKMKTAEAAAKQAHAEVDASAATATRAELEFKRVQELYNSSTVSKQVFDDAQAAAKEAEANLKASQEHAAQTDSQVTESKAQWQAAQTAVDLAKAQVDQADTEIHAAQLDVSYTKITAPCDGKVTRKSVEPGNYVQVGQALMAIVPREVWVVANFKESQLTHMHTNQPVTIKIDAYPDKRFKGHVDGIQAGSGSRFSLLPPENAVGNFVKVVQRVPVKILFDEQPDASLSLGPGMSVVPSVRISTFKISPVLLWIGAAVLGLISTLGLKHMIGHLRG